MASFALIAYVAAQRSLPRGSSATTRWTFIWLAFDGLIHSIYEFSFLYYSWGNRVATSGGLAFLWREYALADTRWAQADPTVVSLELLTVFIVRRRRLASLTVQGAPLCFYICSLLAKGDGAAHYWIVVLSTGELYGASARLEVRLSAQAAG